MTKIFRVRHFNLYITLIKSNLLFTCSGNMFGPTVPAPHKKRSIPNMDKRGSTASGSGLYGLVIPSKNTKVSLMLIFTLDI